MYGSNKSLTCIHHWNKIDFSHEILYLMLKPWLSIQIKFFRRHGKIVASRAIEIEKHHLVSVVKDKVLRTSRNKICLENKPILGFLITSTIYFHDTWIYSYCDPIFKKVCIWYVSSPSLVTLRPNFSAGKVTINHCPLMHKDLLLRVLKIYGHSAFLA